MDTQSFEDGLRAAGYEVLIREIEPQAALPPRAHGWDLRALVLAGSFTLGTRSGAAVFRTGDRFELPAGIAHTQGAGPEGARLLLGLRHRYEGRA